MSLPSVTIGVATYNRKNLLEMMAKSLYMSDLTSFETHIRIYDDCSTDFNEDYLKNLFPGAVTVVRNKKNLKADLNTYNMYCDFLNSEDEFFFNADSDLIFNKNWLNFLKENMAQTDGVLSIFNAAVNHPEIKENAGSIPGGLIQKEHIGAAGTFFSRKRMEEIVENMNAEERKEIDWNFSKMFRRNGVRILCSEESYVQHIGLAFGQHANFFCNDYGKGFKVDSIENGQILNDVMDSLIDFMPDYMKGVKAQVTKHVETNYKNTIDFRLGQMMLKPLRIFKHLLKK